MKKLVAILMVLFLLVGGLAACGETEVPETEETPVTAETPAAEDPEETEEETEEEEEPEVERHEPDAALLEELADRTLDFRSILDTETGAIFTLGDPKSAFEGILGEAEEFEEELRYAEGGRFVFGLPFDSDIVAFKNEGLIVVFEGGAATAIISAAERFELKDTSVTMDSSELSETFVALNLNEEVAIYMRGINLQGEPDHLAVALQQHAQSTEDLVVHHAYVSDGHVTDIILMIH